MSGSLQHACRRAKQVIDAWQAATPNADFQAACRLLPVAFIVARQCCAAADVDFDDLLATQPELKGRPISLVRLPQRYTRLFVKTCADIKEPGTRYATRYYMRHGISLVRSVLTFKAFSGLLGIPFLPEEAPAVLQVAKRGRPITPPVSEAVPKNDGQLTTAGTQSPNEAAAYGTVDLSSDWVSRLQEDQDRRHARMMATFLAMLDGLPPWEPLGPDGFSIPGWDRAPTLPWLRDLFDTVLGPVRRNLTAREQIVPAQPFFVTVADAIATLWPAIAESLETASAVLWPVLTDEKRPIVFFPAPMWQAPAPTQGPLPDWSAAAASVVRRRKLFEPDSDVTQPFSHGYLRQMQVEIAGGKSLLILGAAGTGKSSTLAMVNYGARAVFEVGDGLDASLRGRNSFLLAEFDRLLLKANRTKGRKTLIVNELFLSPAHLAALGIFDQILIVGDPRQPTPTGHVDHIRDFMRRIEARTVVLPIVWRTRNTVSFRYNNYLAYGSAFTAFKPWKVISTGGDADKRDNSLNVISCHDAPGTVAATMLAHAVGKCRNGRSVLIGTDDPDVIAALGGLLQLLPEVPIGLECRHLNDLQGRYADVMIIDALEVAAHVPAVDVALRWWVMIQGRGRYTMSVVVRQRQASGQPSSPLPFLACLATALRWKVDPLPPEVSDPVDLSSAIAKVNADISVDRLDEQTIALCLPIITLFVLVRDVMASNVKLLQEHAAVVEVPEVFEDGRDRGSVVAQIADLLVGPTFHVSPGITTLARIREIWTAARRRL